MAMNTRRFSPRTSSQPVQPQPAPQPQPQPLPPNTQGRQRDANELGCAWSNLVKSKNGDFCVISVKMNAQALQDFVDQAGQKGVDFSETIQFELMERKNKKNPKAPDYIARIPFKLQREWNTAQ